MKYYTKDGILFITLNPAEHVAITLPGSMLDEINKSGKARSDHFVFFTNEEGSLLRIGNEEYEIMKEFFPQSPFDEQLKRIVSEFFLTA